MTKELRYVYNKTSELRADVMTTQMTIEEFNSVANSETLKRLDGILETIGKFLEFIDEADGLDEEES